MTSHFLTKGKKAGQKNVFLNVKVESNYETLGLLYKGMFIFCFFLIMNMILEANGSKKTEAIVVRC